MAIIGEVIPKAVFVTSDGVRCKLQVEKREVDFAVLLGRLEDTKADAIARPTDGNFELEFGKGHDAFATKAGRGPFEQAKAYAKRFRLGEVLGDAVTTDSGKLKNSEKIIHVNYVKKTGKTPCDEESVGVCVENTLKIAEEEGCESVYAPALDKKIWGISVNALMKGTIGGILRYDKVAEKPAIREVGIVLNVNPSFKDATLVQETFFKAIRS